MIAMGAALLPIPAGMVERLYSTGLYLTIQPLLTGASNRTPFALLDLLIVGRRRDMGRLRRSRRRRIGEPDSRRSSDSRSHDSLVRGVLFTVPRDMGAELSPAPPDRQAGVRWRRGDGRCGARRSRRRRRSAECAASTGTCRGDGGTTDGASRVDVGLASAFARAVGDAGIPSSIVVGRPKRTLLDWYFRRAGVDGMTDPFFLETLLASGVLPFERPFLVAHEWSHLAGIADEGEANFVGWLTCRRGSPADQYSGWLFLYQELARAVGARDRAALGSVARRRTSRGSPRDSRSVHASGQPARVGGRLARVRFVPESQSGRSGRRKLRGGRPPRAGRAPGRWTRGARGSLVRERSAGTQRRVARLVLVIHANPETDLRVAPSDARERPRCR